MIKRLLGAAVLATLFAFIFSRASSASVLVDDGDYTLDTVTSLEWLDLSSTVGYSYNDVIANNGVNYIADGWHYATRADFLKLASDAGIPTSIASSNVNFSIAASNALNLMGMLGVTNSFGDFTESFGLLGEQVGDLIATGDLYVGLSYGVGADAYGTLSWPDIGLNGEGSYLIRNVEVAETPLPGSIALFLSSLGLVALIAWRRKTSAGSLRSMTA
jgi:hypothetical protein